MKYLIQIWKTTDLRNKILFTLGILIAFRLLAQLTIPGANIEAIRAIFQRNQFLGALSLLTGGGAENFSIILMGVSPYINASIIVQLFTVIIPKFEALSKEGEMGQRTLNRYTRWLTWPLAFLQSYGMIILLNSQSQIPIVADIGNPVVLLTIMLTITTGTVLLMWLGELISEYGIGNGVSLIIFASIITGIPSIVVSNVALAQASPERLIPFVLMLLVTLILLVLIVFFTEAQQRIPITYAGQGIRPQGEQAALPIRLNQAGMIPIIFAVSLASFPTVVAQFLQNAKSEMLRKIATFMASNFQFNTWMYTIIYFFLVIAFTYFYVSITFNPKQVAENIQKRGGYIPGIRPGTQTADYLGVISNRLNLFGGTFLAFVAVFPIVLNRLMGNSQLGSVVLLLSGSGMIIIVGVVLELFRQINAQMLMHDYRRFY